MKHIIISTVVIAVSLLFSACGGANLEGSWKVDPSSFEIVLGEGFPKDWRGYVDKAKEEAKSERTKKESDNVTLVLKPNGIAEIQDLEHPEDTIAFNWKQSGSVLNLNGEIENENFNVNLDIMGSSNDDVTLGLTGESILKQVRTEKPELLENEFLKMLNLDNMAKGTQLSIKMVRV